MFNCLLFPLLALATPGGSVAAAEVEVAAVKFSHQRPPGGAAGNWLEAEVALNVRPVGGGAGQMVSRVRISLLLGFELPGPAGGERRLEYYRAEAECVALESGRASVRFFLPPEIVKRDGLHGDPRYWGVELSAGGRVLAAGKAAYSLSLPGAEQRKNFQTRGVAAAASNDGILLPQYLTPFVLAYPLSTPTFVRRPVR